MQFLTTPGESRVLFQKPVAHFSGKTSRNPPPPVADQGGRPRIQRKVYHKCEEMPQKNFQLRVTFIFFADPRGPGQKLINHSEKKTNLGGRGLARD